MRGAILTGVWGAGKSTISNLVTARLIAQDCQSLLALPQAATVTAHTYTPGTPADHAVAIMEWLNSLIRFLEDSERRFRAGNLHLHRFAPQWTPTCVLETLGFDAPVYQLPIGRAEHLGMEQRLADLGLHLVVLHVPSDQIQAQCVESTRQHRGPKWDRYLDTFGRDDSRRAEYIQQAQRRLLDWATTSPLPHHIIDTSPRRWDAYASHVADVIMRGATG